MKNINILKDLKTLNKLHVPSVESHTTNNGIVDFTCDNAGYVDNVVIEGETLVNLFSFKKTESSNNNSVWVHINTDYISLFKNVEYTLINTSDKNIFVDIYSNDTNSYKRNLLIKANSSIKDTLASNEHYSKCTGLFSDSWSLSDLSVISSTLIILEGDHIDKPISFFEGLKSVGQGDKIDVLSYSKNLDERLDLSNLTWKDGHYVHIGTGAEIVSESHCYTTNYIPIQKTGCNMVFINANPHIVFYDENKKVIYQGFGYFPSDDLVIVDVPINAKFLRFTGQKSKKNSVSVYYSQYDKKQIPVTLRSLPNGVRDTIEKRGNKYVKVQRCGEVVLYGNVDVPNIYKPNSSLNYHRFLVSVGETPNFGAVCCDRLGSVVDYEIEKDNILADKTYSGFFVTLHNDKTGGTREGFKTWLQANPITVVYELATPQIIELPNFNPQTYKGENTLIMNSGVIQCDASFDVCEGIRSELDVIKNKVSSLDDDYIVDIPIQYLNGWEGSLTCRVNGKCVTLAGMLHGQDVAIKSARTNILKLPINSKAINITTIGLYNVFGQYVGTVELTFDNEIKICHSDFTYNGNYIGLNLSWFLH